MTSEAHRLRVLADENIPRPLVVRLREEGHDVVWVVESNRGEEDPSLLALAQREERILLTFDADFGGLAILRRLPAASGVILLRIQSRSQAGLIEQAMAILGQPRPWYGHFSVIESGRIRMRRLPGGTGA